MSLGDLFNRYEETNTIGFIPLFPDDGKDEYYNRTIIQTAAYAETIHPSIITASLLDINKKLSYRGLDKLGGSSDSYSSITTIDLSEVLPILLQVDDTATEVDKVELGGAGGIRGLTDYVYYYNSKNYGASYEIDDNSIYKSYWFINNLWMKIKDGNLHADNDTVSWNITYVELNGTTEYTESASVSKHVDFWIVYYQSNVPIDNNGVDVYDKSICIDDRDMTAKETIDGNVMTVKYKVAGKVNNSKYINA